MHLHLIDCNLFFLYFLNVWELWWTSHICAPESHIWLMESSQILGQNSTYHPRCKSQGTLAILWKNTVYLTEKLSDPCKRCFLILKILTILWRSNFANSWFGNGAIKRKYSLDQALSCHRNDLRPVVLDMNTFLQIEGASIGKESIVMGDHSAILSICS